MRTRTGLWILGAVVALIAGLSLLLLSLAGRRSNGGQPAISPVPTEASPTATSEAGATFVPSSPTPSPGPLLYTVEAGDTLASIAAMYGVAIEELVAANQLADPDLIYPGQTLIIPGRAAPPTEPPDAPLATLPADVPLPTLVRPSAGGPLQVEIVGVVDAGSLENECILIRNGGGPVDLEGWSVSDAAGDQFVFPRLTLFSDAEVRVCSRGGHNSPLELFWGREAPAWRSGELIVLKDRHGTIVDTSIVP